MIFFPDSSFNIGKMSEAERPVAKQFLATLKNLRERPALIVQTQFL